MQTLEKKYAPRFEKFVNKQTDGDACLLIAFAAAAWMLMLMHWKIELKKFNFIYDHRIVMKLFEALRETLAVRRTDPIPFDWHCRSERQMEEQKWIKNCWEQMERRNAFCVWLVPRVFPRLLLCFAFFSAVQSHKWTMFSDCECTSWGAFFSIPHRLGMVHEISINIDISLLSSLLFFFACLLITFVASFSALLLCVLRQNI